MVVGVSAAAKAALRQLVEERLGTTLEKWIVKSGLKDASVRTIAGRLSEAAGIEVSKSTLHRWLE
jgi:head-tail adaptor